MSMRTEAIRAPHPPHHAHSIAAQSSRPLVFTTVGRKNTIYTGFLGFDHVFYSYYELGQPSQRSGSCYDLCCVDSFQACTSCNTYIYCILRVSVIYGLIYLLSYLSIYLLSYTYLSYLT